jgi:hypothetical protein
VGKGIGGGNRRGVGVGDRGGRRGSPGRGPRRGPSGSKGWGYGGSISRRRGGGAGRGIGGCGNNTLPVKLEGLEGIHRTAKIRNTHGTAGISRIG